MLQRRFRNQECNFHISWKDNINKTGVFIFQYSIARFLFDFLNKYFLVHVKLLQHSRSEKKHRVEAEVDIMLQHKNKVRH